MASEVKSEEKTDCDPYVEELRKKYLFDSTMTKFSQNSSGTTNDFSPSEIVSCSPSSSLTESERRHYMKAMVELKNLLQIGESKLEKSVAQYESALKKDDETDSIRVRGVDDDDKEDALDNDTTLVQSVSLPTFSTNMLSSGSEKPQKSVRISLEPTTYVESDTSTKLSETWHGPGILKSSNLTKNLEPTDVKVIYAELMNIHTKLNEKSRNLAQLQEDLCFKEQELISREEELSEYQLPLNQANIQRARDVMERLQGVETKVQEKFILLQEHHAIEMEHLHKALSEKTRECKRLKHSFEIMKNHNDELKEQETKYVNINEKLRIQNHKLKKRLENLQRKCEYNSARTTTDQVLNDHTNIVKSEDKQPATVFDKSIDKSPRVWSNSLEALSITLDWLSEGHLGLSTAQQQGKADSGRLCREAIIDKCLKVLPLLVEVVRYLPASSSQSKYHLPYLRFIYWSLHHLEDAHHGLLSSTSRRIGEELIKPSLLRIVGDASLLSSSVCDKTLPFSGSTSEGKPKNQFFFRSTNVEIRMLSCFIILKTLHQVDVLAQVFDQLKKDLKDEANRKYFLEYAATQAVLPYLTYKTNKSLLGNVVDVMLQMAMDSKYLPPFLDLCSSEVWFRAVSSAIRAIIQSSDTATLEKLSVILQKLSKIKSNKKYFETFSLGRALQEQYRECDPGSTFLSLNLRSILFNLNMIKSN